MANNNKHTGPNVPALRFPEFSGEWDAVLLGFISDIKTGPFGSTLHADDYVEEGTPIITTEHFKKGHLPTEKKGLPQVSDDDLKRLKQYSLEENDIVFSRVGSVDINARVGKENEGWLFSGRVLRVKLKDFDSRYIHYVLSTQTVRNDIVSRAVGQTMPSINTGILSNTSITIAPSIEEQKKLGRLFEILDARIIAQSKIIEELKTLRGALVDTYINDGNNNNDNQTIMSLGAYGCFVRGLTYSSVDVTDNTATTGVVRSNNLEYGSPVDIKSGLVYVTKKPSPEQMLVNGDIVICMANGSSSLVGKASNYQELCRNMTVGAFCGIYRGTHPLTKWIFMSSAYCKAVANAIQGGNGAIANLYAEDILSMCFAVPSDYKTITELGKLLSLFDEKLHAAEEQLARFIEQKKYFLFKMFI